MEELNPCPKCNGKITLYTVVGVGVVARCRECKSEFDVCGVDELKLYNGCKIRKSTIRKIEKMWNRSSVKNG